jgi:hypothetical protein
MNKLIPDMLNNPYEQNANNLLLVNRTFTNNRDKPRFYHYLLRMDQQQHIYL